MISILKLWVVEVVFGVFKVESYYKVYFEGGWYDILLFKLENLGFGYEIFGFVIIMNGNSIVIVEFWCKFIIIKYGNIRIELEVVVSSVKFVENVVDVV